MSRLLEGDPEKKGDGISKEERVLSRLVERASRLNRLVPLGVIAVSLEVCGKV